MCTSQPASESFCDRDTNCCFEKECDASDESDDEHSRGACGCGCGQEGGLPGDGSRCEDTVEKPEELDDKTMADLTSLLNEVKQTLETANTGLKMTGFALPFVEERVMPVIIIKDEIADTTVPVMLSFLNIAIDLVKEAGSYEADELATFTYGMFKLAARLSEGIVNVDLPVAKEVEASEA